MKKVYLFILFIILLQTNGIAASWKYNKIKQASVYQAQVCYAQCLATYLRQQGLANGMYVLQIIDATGIKHNCKFVKQ
jgi:hypothetical protein